MEVNKIFCFLVLAQKKAKELKENIGKEVSCNEPIYKIVSDILKNLESSCNIPIKFLSVSGTQDNEVLLNLRKLNDDFSLDNAKYLSTRLSSCTDLTMKNGLFFIIKLCNEKDERIVLFRIPAETGIMIKNSKENNFQLDISDDVFIKNSHKFKIAYFDKVDNFLTGFAIDKQINQDKKIKYISDYWIKDFLNCELSMTPKRGTKMLAEAIRKTIEVTDSETVQKELTSVISMIPNVDQKMTSFEGFFSLMNLSEETKNEVLSKLSTINSSVQFQIDSEEFNSNCTYQFLIMNNGAIAIAPSKDFDTVWTLTKNDDKTTIKSCGKVVKTKYKQKV